MTAPTIAPPRPGQPTADGLQPGAVGWSNVYYDEEGVRRTSRTRVQIDQHGQVAAVEWSCPKCHSSRQYPPSMKRAPVCVACKVQMQRATLRTPPVLPWRELGQALNLPARPLVPFAAAAGCAELAHLHHLSGLAFGVGGAAAALAVRKVTAMVLVRRAARRGRLADADEDRRFRQTLAKRARMAGYGTAAGAAWLALATETGLNPAEFGGLMASMSLPLVAAGASYPWWSWLARQRRRRSKPAVQVVAEQAADRVDPFEAEVRATWTSRVAHPAGPLPGTKLTGFRYVKGGWAATIVSNTPGSIEPDRWRNATGRVAAAYQCGLTDVSLELDGGNASQATVLVQRENPLTETAMWPGPEPTWDFGRGVSMVGRFGDGEATWYRWWNDGGPWHDLISGCTGSGKSELVNQLLLAELHSGGRILSRVIDPQWGQSFGDLQDYVDWFAPCVAEAQMLLLDTVKQMYRRNRLYSRRRQKCWRPDGDEPLIVVTIDEAHEVLKDPICLALVERLAKMARKCGIKLRIITQVPVVTEIGNSTPIKDALLAGNIIVFRTGSAISSQVSIGATLPVDPHKLPAEWPKGSPGEGKTTAGLGFMAGASRREVPWRSFYNGDGPALRKWLALPDGTPIVTPGMPSAAMVTESGVFWAGRRERVRLLFEQPPSDADLLPEGLVEALTLAAQAALRGERPPQQTAGAQSTSGETQADDGWSRIEALRTAVRLADAQGRVRKGDIAAEAKCPDGTPMPAGTLGGVLTALVADRSLLRVKNGVYELTDRARVEVGRDAAQTVEALVGPEPTEAADGVVPAEPVEASS